MNYKAISRQMRAAIAGLALLGAGSSCVNDNSLCPEDQPGYRDGNDVWLSLSITNYEPGPDRASRATDPEGHPEEVSTPDENYIDTDDVTLMLLDGNGLVMKVFGRDEFVVSETSGTTDNDRRDYDLKFKVNRAYFGSATTGNISFRLLMVANSRGTDDAAPETFGPDLFAYNVPRLAALHRSFSYTGTTAGAQPWTPSIAAGRHIPMAGIRSYTVSATALDAATDAAAPLTLTDPIEMQRAMAKIRVIDNIAGDVSNPWEERITSVSLRGASSRGSFIPESTNWITQTYEVEDATWEADWYNAADVRALTAPVTEAGQFEGRPYMLGYVTECHSTVFDPNKDTVPVLVITTTNNAGVTKTHEVRLTDIKDPGVRALSRNHVYEFVVSKSWQAQIEVNWTVCDWNTAETNVGFN